MIPVVSYYTVNTPYADEASKMRDSARAVGLNNVRSVGINSRANWEANCQAKIEVLLNFCKEYDKPFLYVDVDARFQLYPVLFDSCWDAYDLGFHMFRGRELLSGTLWVNPTVNTVRVLKECLEAFRSKPKAWDQKVLQEVLSRHPEVLTTQLPPEYAFIYDLSRKVYGVDLNPVIIHYQASRKYKFLKK